MYSFAALLVDVKQSLIENIPIHMKNAFLSFFYSTNDEHLLRTPKVLGSLNVLSIMYHSAECFDF